ncbi:MAG: hypothetical protein ACI4TK_17885, partial [Agathobacter sp.]
EYDFFEERITDVIEEQVYDRISDYMQDEFDMSFEIDDGYTLTLHVTMKTDEDFDYDPFTESYDYGNWKKWLMISNVWAECKREGDDDDDYIECNVTNLFDTELKWEKYDSDIYYRSAY